MGYSPKEMKNMVNTINAFAAREQFTKKEIAFYIQKELGFYQSTVLKYIENALLHNELFEHPTTNVIMARKPEVSDELEPVQPVA